MITEFKREGYSLLLDEPEMYVNNEARNRSGHMTHAMAEFAPNCLIDFNANSSADRIVAAANAEATRIMTETEDEATYIRARLSDAADRMLTHISTELHASTDHCLGELMTALREMRDNTGALLADFEKRNRDLKEKVAYYQTSLNDTIHKALTEMDQKYGIRLPNRKD